MIIRITMLYFLHYSIVLQIKYFKSAHIYTRFCPAYLIGVRTNTLNNYSNNYSLHHLYPIAQATILFNSQQRKQDVSYI